MGEADLSKVFSNPKRKLGVTTHFSKKCQNIKQFFFLN